MATPGGPPIRSMSAACRSELTMTRRSPATGACSAKSVNASLTAQTRIAAICFVIGNDVLGQHQIGLQQRLGSAFHRDAGEPAHVTQPLGDSGELLVIGGAHASSLGVTSAKGWTRGRLLDPHTTRSGGVVSEGYGDR
jgi:hypothetical protein